MRLPGDQLLKKTGTLKSPVLMLGFITGILLTGVMAGALVAANRMPHFERWALERNALSFGAFFLVMLIPVLRFRRAPRRLFACGMVGWTIFLLGYLMAGTMYTQLFRVLRTPFEVLVDGALAYGLLAAGMWIYGMVVAARHHHHQRHLQEAAAARSNMYRAGR
jgi:hypothetical protein